MSTSPSPSPPAKPTSQPPPVDQADGLGGGLLDEKTEQRLDAIEMIGEEELSGFRPPGHSDVSAGMRYLHSSRTIQQLVTDRNRTVGIYLAVASLLWTASTALLNAKPNSHLIVPIEVLQRWCLPATFGTLAVLALFASLLLVRTRVGLIYEVAKMNVLLGLPVGRVQRINPLGIFFIMHLVIVLAGGASATLFAWFMLIAAGSAQPLAWAVPIGVVIIAGLVGLYIGMVRYTTADRKLQGVK